MKVNKPLKRVESDEEARAVKQKAREQLLNFKPASEEIKVGVEIEVPIYQAHVGLGVAVPISRIDEEQVAPKVVRELGDGFSTEFAAWSVEYKSEPKPLGELSALFSELAEKDSRLRKAIERLWPERRLFLNYVGIANPSYSPGEMTEEERYRIIAEEIGRRRGAVGLGLPLLGGGFHRFEFKGIEDFTFLHSTHIHISCPLQDVAAIHNISLFLSGIMLGIASKGGVFRGKKLAVAEPRIPLFETLIDLRSEEERRRGLPSISGFPERFFRSYEDAINHYLENYPLVLTSSEPGRTFLGQVWKWVRVKVYDDQVGVEARMLPSMHPAQLRDIVSLYVGLLLHLYRNEKDAFMGNNSTKLHRLAKHSFYSCASAGNRGDVPSLAVDSEVKVRGALRAALSSYREIAEAALKEEGIETGLEEERLKVIAL